MSGDEPPMPAAEVADRLRTFLEIAPYSQEGRMAAALLAEEDHVRALLTRLVDLLDAYDRTSLLDPGVRRSLAQRRRRALDDAREFLAVDTPEGTAR